MVAFPQLWADSTEKRLSTPLQVVVSAQQETIVRIRNLSAMSDIGPGFDKTYLVHADSIITVPIPVSYVMPSADIQEARYSSVIRGFGVEVTGSAPISVSTYQVMEGNGEMVHHLPVEAWGKQYTTMNFYQDRYTYDYVNLKYRPSEIVVIASEDSTIVNYAPTWETEGGPDAMSVRAGKVGTIELMAGQVFLVKGIIDEPLTKDFTTDLSGSRITANKPVAVVSGHTKVAIMRMPDYWSWKTDSSASRQIMQGTRNAVLEAMLPTAMAGTEFITIPVMYTDKRNGRDTITQGSMYGFDSMKGDVIRFNSLDDGNILSACGGVNHWIDRRTLRKNESYIEANHSQAILWRTSKPALCAQYGKSWSLLPYPETYTLETGQPMMQIVPSTDRWICNGIFLAPPNMDNFFGIVFNTIDSSRIVLDGKTLADLGRAAFTPIVCTNYSYLRLPVPEGLHVLASLDESVRWTAWSYGSHDGDPKGHAYGVPVGVDYSIPCADSIVINESATCGTFTSTATLEPAGQACGAFYMIVPVNMKNYELRLDQPTVVGSSTASYSMHVVSPMQDASGTVRLVTRSGRYLERDYTYTAPKVAYDPWVMNVGNVRADSLTCRMMTVNNPSATDSLVITRMYAKANGAYVNVSPAALRLAPQESKTVEVCISLPAGKRMRDTIQADVQCGALGLSEITASTDGTYTSVQEDGAASGDVHITSVVPNPGRDAVDVFIDAASACTLDLVASTGQTVLRMESAAGRSQMRLQLGAIASGSYTVVVRSASHVSTAHLVVLP